MERQRNPKRQTKFEKRKAKLEKTHDLVSRPPRLTVKLQQWETGYSVECTRLKQLNIIHMQKRERERAGLKPHLPPYAKIPSKWIRDLNIKPNVVRLLEGTSKKPCDFAL